MLKITCCIYLFVFYYNLNTTEWLKITPHTAVYYIAFARVLSKGHYL